MSQWEIERWISEDKLGEYIFNVHQEERWTGKGYLWIVEIVRSRYQQYRPSNRRNCIASKYTTIGRPTFASQYDKKYIYRVQQPTKYGPLYLFNQLGITWSCSKYLSPNNNQVSPVLLKSHNPQLGKTYNNPQKHNIKHSNSFNSNSQNNNLQHSFQSFSIWIFQSTGIK